MRHYLAREIQRDGKGTGLFHYTCGHGDNIYAVGHCSPTEVCSCFAAKLCGDPSCEKCGGRGFVNKPSPCTGHATKEEASAHYREFELDTMRLVADEGKLDQQYKCVECGAWTQGYADVGEGSGQQFFLCPAHLNRAVVEKHFKGESESWRS